MHYISEFTRSKPIAVCVALKLPKVQLPQTLGSDNSHPNSRHWRKNWRTQMDTAFNTMGIEKKNVSQSHYQGLLEKLEQALHSVYARFLLGTVPDPTITDRLDLIRDLCILGRYADACRYLNQTIALQTLEDGNDSLELANSYRWLARMQLSSGHDDARHNAQTARDIYISNLGHNNPDGFACDLIVAETALSQEDLTVAQDIVSDILVRAAVSQTPVPLVEARALHLQALVAGIQRKLPLALEHARKASTRIQDSVEDDPLLLPKYRMFEAILHRKMAQWDEACACFEHAHIRLRTLLPDHHFDMGYLILEAGRFYMLKEDLEQARTLLEQAQVIFAKLEHAKLERLITATFLARLHRIGGHFKPAKHMIRRGRKAGNKLQTANSKWLQAANAEWQFRIELERAHILLLDGKYAEAEPSLQALLHDRSQLMTPSQQGELHLLLGQAQWQQHNLDAAKASLQQALHFLHHPMLVAEDLHLRTRVLLDLAELRIMEQNPANARQAVQDAQHNLALHTLEQEWLTGRSAYLQGRIALMTEDYLQAQSHFEQALAHLESSTAPCDNLSASCTLWLAQSLLKSDHIARVVAVLQPMVDSQEYKHLAAQEDRMRVLYFLALALYAEEDIDTAFKYGQRAYKCLGKLPDGHLSHTEEYEIRRFIGSLHLYKNQYQPAIEILCTLLDMNTRLSLVPVSVASIHDQLAGAYLHLKQLAKAEDHWRQCLAIYQQVHAPTSLPVCQVRARLAGVLKRRDQWDQALHEYLILDQHSPPSLPRQYTIAHLQYRLGQMAPAQERLEQLVQSPDRLRDAGLDPLNLFLLLSRIHISCRRPQTARSVLQEVLARFGRQSSDGVIAEVNQTLAELMEQQGDLAAAVTYWQQALTRHETQGATESIWQCCRKLFRLSWQHRQYEASLGYGNAALKLATAHAALFKKPRIIRLCLDLGAKYATLGKPSEAFKCYGKGVALADVNKSRKHVPLAAQCFLATADLLTLSQPAEAERKHQRIQDLYKRKEIQPDTTLAQSCMQYGLLLWDRNELERALRAMTSAHDAHQHVADQAEHAPVPHSQIMTLQYLILLHADLGQPKQALSLLSDQLQSLMQRLPHKDIPRQLALTTVQDQVHLLGGLPA